LNEPHYDVVIIGGGIHGAGVAQAAAAEGHSVLLLEQSGLASGTSSRSSKLIHGGLRYLESAQFRVVRECLRERSLLLKLAPELVRLVPFYSPIYSDTHRRPWQIRIGLSLYRLLTGFDASGRFARVPPGEWDGLDGLEQERLDAVFRFYDAQTDDALLTKAVMRSALGLGAELAMPARFTAAERHEGGCTIRYLEGNNEKGCRARILINAAGPWANEVLARITPAITPLAMDLVQGTHLLLPEPLTKGIYYVEAPQDGRAVFIMPWGGNTLVGTTETPYKGDPAAVRPLLQEQHYLLEVLSHYFPRYRDVAPISAFAGLRVLPAGGGRAFGRSRETLLHTDRSDSPRVLTIYGGKLTAYRAAAEQVMARIVTSLPRRHALADTRCLPLAPE
jgi:glycerol-3-phosphate dehydrogenase